jgi:hypothetical protein
MKNERVNKDKAVSGFVVTRKMKRFFFWCLILIIPLVLMEIFSYTFIRLTSDKGTYRERIKPVANPYHPYLGYVHAPNYNFSITKKTVSSAKKMNIKTDESGYSITPVFSHKEPEMTIAVTGGSTMFGVGSSDNSTTVPSILERLINERLGIRAEVINLALRGAQSFQEMLLVDRYFAENQVDLVLSISGTNDAIYVFLEPALEGAFLPEDIWNNAVMLVHRAERGDLMIVNFVHKLRSWSYTFDFLYRQIKHDTRLARSGIMTFQAPPQLNLRKETKIGIEKRAKLTATHFAALNQICEMNDAEFVMFLQPALSDKNNWSEVESQRMIRRKWSDAVIQKRRQSRQEFYKAFRKTEKPFKFIDLTDIFSSFKETHYIDPYHYNDLAAEKLAEKIFDSIEPILQTIRRG